jgi:hypothetical protein
MTLNIQIGKTYITHCFEPDEPKDNDIVTIVDIVRSDSIEYLRGFRYVTHNGDLYTEYGTSKNDGLANLSDYYHYTILREASVEDLRTTTEEFARMNLEDCEKSDKFIRSDDPNFFMALNGIYVDYCGMMVFIDKVYHFNDTDLWGSDGGIRFISSRGGYTPKGRDSDERLSMQDIAYQKVG